MLERFRWFLNLQKSLLELTNPSFRVYGCRTGHSRLLQHYILLSRDKSIQALNRSVHPSPRTRLSLARWLRNTALWAGEGVLETLSIVGNLIILGVLSPEWHSGISGNLSVFKAVANPTGGLYDPKICPTLTLMSFSALR